jgi:ribosome-associated translation inhibitor RaiA
MSTHISISITGNAVTITDDAREQLERMVERLLTERQQP